MLGALIARKKQFYIEILESIQKLETKETDISIGGILELLSNNLQASESDVEDCLDDCFKYNWVKGSCTKGLDGTIYIIERITLEGKEALKFLRRRRR